MQHRFGSHHDDPEFQRLRQEFVREALQRTRELAGILEETGGSLPKAEVGNRFRKIAHELRGAGGSYGFPVITLYAGDAEDSYLEAGNPQALTAIVEMLDGAVRRAGALVGIPDMPK